MDKGICLIWPNTQGKDESSLFSQLKYQIQDLNLKHEEYDSFVPKASQNEENLSIFNFKLDKGFFNNNLVHILSAYMLLKMRAHVVQIRQLGLWGLKKKVHACLAGSCRSDPH